MHFLSVELSWNALVWVVFFPLHAWFSANQFLTGSHRSFWIYGHRASPARSPYCTIFYFCFWNPMFRNIPVISVWTCTPCIIYYIYICICIYIYIHSYMTWHDMTWHDMTWHDMTWHDIRYITLRTYVYTHIPTYLRIPSYTYIPAYTYIPIVGMCLHTYIPTSLHPYITTSLHPYIHPSIHLSIHPHGTCFMALFYAQVRSIESQRNSPGFPVFSSKSSKRPHH